MPAIPKSEAAEKLARAVEEASSDDLLDIYTELFPERPPPDASQAKALVEQVASYIRTKIQPEEIVDLWNVAFPADRNVYYDDEAGVVIYNQEAAWYAGR